MLFTYSISTINFIKNEDDNNETSLGSIHPTRCGHLKILLTTAILYERENAHMKPESRPQLPLLADMHE